MRFSTLRRLPRVAQVGCRVALILASICLGAIINIANVHARPPHPKAPVIATGVLPPTVRTALLQAGVLPSSMSVVVERIDEARPILSVNAKRAMIPASTIKLLTTFAGLSILGPDFRWQTKAYADGELKNGILRGNLYIKGSGDPKLIPEELIDLVEQIRQAGVVSIEGDLVLDKSYFADSTRYVKWFDENANAPYKVNPDPLLYAFKSLTFTLTPQANGEMLIMATPPLEQLYITDTLHITPGACAGGPAAVVPAVQFTADGSTRVAFSGEYPLACGTRVKSVSVLDHTQFFARGFLALWRQSGGTFSGHVREGPHLNEAKLVGLHKGPVLAEIVQDINKFSNNSMANNLFLTIGAQSAKPPADLAKSVGAIKQWLHRTSLTMPELVISNGSGLSNEARISARSLAALLRAANQSSVAQAFVESLPIVGVDGTMRYRLLNTPLVGRARIKTGTLNEVRAIAGYVSAANGASYIVVSMINDPRAPAAQAAHDALLEWVYQRLH
ncbi:D-alanyl-D-alanine carboxypeptidase/D-alanyl-D-alanine-endopeptidase [Mycoavidus sp. B2-EB]|uniref:D-alanyl-D-alanine carboxypeptidase/D-alanyl-D-alanine endopeptidase n=1 Tax=Mycoavidus sp. B2-EB TaxID=2651972 RepID=UPI001629E4D6|nr:D-alanyl-D-alanine carboxypeptidase/D-alanyl-D-alanine-endopeptidase [Mycoavidus sp. B2-EB]BBO60204.1 peptidase [Mycoavidus sp. B2-EB]